MQHRTVSFELFRSLPYLSLIDSHNLSPTGLRFKAICYGLGMSNMNFLAVDVIYISGSVTQRVSTFDFNDAADLCFGSSDTVSCLRLVTNIES